MPLLNALPYGAITCGVLPRAPEAQQRHDDTLRSTHATAAL